MTKNLSAVTRNDAFMITVPQQKKAGGDNRWLVKNEQGETFGPVDFETLKLWAKDGRVAPTNTLSENGTAWLSVTQLPDLEMNWVAEVSPGTFYGPIHKLALETLQKEGALPKEAVAFQRASQRPSASKTQPLTPVQPVVPLPSQESAAAVRALERQLDLERQRSHDILKQLQQVEERMTASSEQRDGLILAGVERLAKQQKALQETVVSAQQAVPPAKEVAVALPAPEQSEQRLAVQCEKTHRQLAETLTGAQQRATAALSQQLVADLAALRQHVCTDVTAALQEASAQSAQALGQVTQASRHAAQAAAQTAQAIAQGVEPLAAELLQNRQELERLAALVKAAHGQTAEAVVSAVALRLDKGREALSAKMAEELAASRAQLFERTHAALTHGNEQLMRATGDSQRLAMEYIVREITTLMNTALQAHREPFLQSLRGGWAETQQHAAEVKAQLRELTDVQTRLERELKSAAQQQERTRETPVVERTYVEVEVMETLPPEKPHKKPAPEPVPEPAPAGKAPRPQPAAGQGLSMAAIEQQARRELERLGAQGMNIFKRTK